MPLVEDREQLELKAYELTVEKNRWDLESYAELLASLILSVSLPVFGLVKFCLPVTWKHLWFPGVGWILIVLFFIYHLKKLKKFDEPRPKSRGPSLMTTLLRRARQLLDRLAKA
jgi:hypothetical protein